MKSTVSVTHQVRVAAALDNVWAIIADPSMQERLDPRCSVLSACGDWRAAGSEFVLVVRGVRLRYVVVAADPGVSWVAQVDRGGKQVAIQRGELSRVGTDTLLRWTVTATAGPLTRRLVRRSCERELRRWLAAVEREALAADR